MDADHTKSKIMKTVYTLFIGMFLTFGVLYTQAQSKSPGANYESNAYEGFYLGGNASTNGWGFNARYAFTNWFALKTGFERLEFTYNFDFEEYGIDYNADMNFKTGGILLLADFSYTKNLYISTGAIFNSFNPKVSGQAASDYVLNDIVIPAKDIGAFSIEAQPELKVSPYIGAGYQAFMGRSKRLVFNFETGLYYMGSPDLTIKSDGLLEPTSNPSLGQEAYLENQFDAYKIYPVIKLNLAYRIF